MPPVPDFASHRRALLDRLPEGEAVLVFGGPHHHRNADTEYKYRPDSDVYWLSGWEDPEVAVFLRHGDKPFTLFVQPKDAEREVWTGFRHGPEGAVATFGASEAFTFDELAEQLPRLLQGVTALHYAFAVDAERDRMLMGAIARAARAGRKNGLSVPETFHAPSKLLHELRLHKQPAELEVMREAARVTTLAHLAAMHEARPGRTEYEIEALLDYTFRSNGGTGAAYGNIVAAGANACILHYVTNRETLRDGDLLLIDAGCEVSYYACDVTRTFPVGGRFTEPQRRVYEWVLAAQEAAIAAAVPGAPYRDMHDAAIRVLTEGLVDLGILEGDIDALVASEAFKPWYMHGTGHWLGLDVHDAGVYGREGSTRPLAPGMVVTVEPGLYIRTDDERAPAELRGIGVRIEDDVLVTAAGHEILTAGIPKSVRDVEAACRGELAAK